MLSATGRKTLTNSCCFGANSSRENVSSPKLLTVYTLGKPSFRARIESQATKSINLNALPHNMHWLAIDNSAQA